MSKNKRLLLVILLAVGIPLIGAGIIGGSLVIQSLRKPDVPATTVVDNFLAATFTRHDEAAALAMMTAAGRRDGSHLRKLMYNYLSSDVGKIVELHWNDLRELVTNDQAIVICMATVKVYSNGQILDLSRGWHFTLLPVHRQWLVDDWS